MVAERDEHVPNTGTTPRKPDGPGTDLRCEVERILADQDLTYEEVLRRIRSVVDRRLRDVSRPG